MNKRLDKSFEEEIINKLLIIKVKCYRDLHWYDTNLRFIDTNLRSENMHISVLD